MRIYDLPPPPPQKKERLLSGIFPMKHMFCVRKRNVSGRRFFYAPKTYDIIDRYLIVKK